MLLTKSVTVARVAVLFSLVTACSPAPEKASQTHEETMMTTPYSRLSQLEIAAPKVGAREATVSLHGIEISDPYQWLRDTSYPDTDDPDILDYLHAENAYYQAFLEPNKPLVDRLFAEFKGRIDETESSVPFVKNGYEYRWEFKPGNNYRTRYRKNLSSGVEEIYLDEQALASGYDYFVMGSWDISPDNKLVIYTVDTTGDERYSAIVKDIASGEVLPIDLTDISGAVSFTPDGEGIIYGQVSAERWRVESINWRAVNIDTEGPTDKVIFREDNTEYFLGYYFTSDNQWLVKYSGQNGSSDIQVLPLSDLSREPITVVTKQERYEAILDAAHGKFYMLANDEHVNFRLLSIDTNTDIADKTNWTTLIAGSDQRYLMRLQTFKDFMLIKLRDNGLEQIQLLDFAGNLIKQVEFPEPAYTADLGTNEEFDMDVIQLRYTSMITQNTVYNYRVEQDELVTVKVDLIPSGYDKTNYVTERLMAPARDGAQVPISVVYHKNLVKDGQAPLSLFAYGAYGSGVTPSFSGSRLSLLDRGFVYAIAHIRGGDEMGYQWYLDGKMKKRKNAFNDFIDVAQFMIDQNYTSAGNISISGGSAGGQLMGVMVNSKPDLWRSVTLAVPFVDVLNTMLDPTLPLTPPEWQEWGNPIESKEYFEYILSYSPYDQIQARNYPPMMVTGGLNDPRVTYWEPAKWTARMRATKTDSNLLVMRMNMGAGHSANSGRYGRLKDRAEEYAFQLVAHGISE